MKRALGAGVLVKAGPTEKERVAAILGGQAIVAYQPTESEVRDAVGRLTRELEDMRLARGADWEPRELDWAIVIDPASHDVILRGTLLIEREDFIERSRMRPHQES